MPLTPRDVQHGRVIENPTKPTKGYHDPSRGILYDQKLYEVVNQKRNDLYLKRDNLNVNLSNLSSKKVSERTKKYDKAINQTQSEINKVDSRIRMLCGVIENWKPEGYLTFNGSTPEKMNGWVSFAKALNIIEPTVIDTNPKTKKPIVGYINRQGFCVASITQYPREGLALSLTVCGPSRHSQIQPEYSYNPPLVLHRSPAAHNTFAILVAAVREQIYFANTLLREEIISRQDSHFSTRNPVTHSRDTFYSSSASHAAADADSARLIGSHERTSYSFT